MTYKELKAIITTANANAEKGFSEIPENITTATAELNEKQKYNFCLKVGKDAETFKEMFLSPSITIAESMSKPSEIANAVKFSCVFKAYKISINDENLIEIDDFYSPIYFSDIIKALTKHNATAHADGKPTKEDKAKALEKIISYRVLLINALATHNAQILTSRGNADGTDETRETNATYEKAYSAINKKYKESGKENPFDKISGNALTAQIKEIATAFGVSADNLTKYHAIALYQMMTATNKRTATRTIGNLYDMIDAFAIVNRYAHNGIKIPDFDKSNIYKKPKKDK
jgi:hypothetical protein